MSNIIPIIMCGGSGTRLWPSSTHRRPKQFLPLIGERSLFLMTVDRMSRIPGVDQIIVIAGRDHRESVLEQVADAPLSVSILLEPEGRDSAPAIAAAAGFAKTIDPDCIAVVVASDHYIADTDHFCSEILTTIDSAEQGNVVTLGISPTHPSPAYGYIKPETKQSRVAPVDAFVEKPSQRVAETYIEAGYLWNSGMFVAKAGVLLEELEEFEPQIAHHAVAAVDAMDRDGSTHLLPAQFVECPKVSFDYAVMERTDKAQVLSTRMAWSDLGSWDALYEIAPKDSSGNALQGRVETLNSRGSLVRAAKGKRVALIGAKDLCVVVENDDVLVARLAETQGVKDIAVRFQAEDKARAMPEQAVPRSAAEELTSWLFTAALPLWYTVGLNHQTDLWAESLDQEGRPTSADMRARVQVRQGYVFGLAGALGWSGPWQDAVAKSIRGLDRYVLGPSGLMRGVISPAGEVIEDRTVLYDQAFYLLCLAQGRSVIEDADRRATDHLDRIEKTYSNEGGRGFRETYGHPFQSNPHMHLLEAALVWCEALPETDEGRARWAALAHDLLDLAQDAFIDPTTGALYEYFDQHWRRAEGPEGDVVEPGHQFEWAWLFLRACSLLGHRDDWAENARGLFAVGCRGIDPASGIVLDRLDGDLNPATEVGRLWPQTERLKAALSLMALGSENEADYREHAAESFAAIRSYLETRTNGLWRDKHRVGNGFEEEVAPASSLYHLATAIDCLAKAQAAGTKL